MNWRNTDPITSREAGVAITSSGKSHSLQQQCLEYIREHPDETAGEIGDGTGLGHDKVWRRLSELKNNGYIVMGEPKVWHGRRQGTWRLVQQEPEQAEMEFGRLYQPADRRH